MAGPPAAPITRQVGGERPSRGSSREPRELAEAARRLVLDGDGRGVPFGALYGETRAIVVFVRHFLCYTCKEYVEDLAKIPKNLLQDAKVKLIVIGQSSYHHIKPFCSLTEYPHEIYVDPEREIYKILGMKRGESATTSGANEIGIRPSYNGVDFAYSVTVHKISWAVTHFVRFVVGYSPRKLMPAEIKFSPHVKSNFLSGSIRSMWRAMTGPAFDFQGDPAQQGGTLILGPGSKVHFVHLDKNRLDHAPINTVLQLAGVKTVNFKNKHQIIDI